MTIFRHDPHRPGIDGATIVCPGCGQSYDTILDSQSRLPESHYRQPTFSHRNGRDIVAVSRTGVGQTAQKLCSTRGDELVRRLFVAQLEAARTKEAA